MKDLIDALTIFLKYSGDDYKPTHCEHDVLYVPGVNPLAVSEADLLRLEKLGFIPNTEVGGFSSFRFGSC